MKVDITTLYEIVTEEGEILEFRVDTEIVGPLAGTLDIHNEKVGALERKLLKDHE